jgi:adenosylmethionine-8-amino-7-oxononanoate aminotransferase
LLVTHRKVGMLACATGQRVISPQEFYQHGLYVVTKGADIILCPALNYTPKELEKQLEKLRQLLHTTMAVTKEKIS